MISGDRFRCGGSDRCLGLGFDLMIVVVARLYNCFLGVLSKCCGGFFESCDYCGGFIGIDWFLLTFFCRILCSRYNSLIGHKKSEKIITLFKYLYMKASPYPETPS